MIDVNSKFSYSVGLRTTYKEAFSKNPKDYVALHRYILCIVYGSQFYDEHGTTNMGQVDELLNHLEIAVLSNDAQPYECQFFFEICRALGYDERINKWLEERPEHEAYCRLSELSYEILVHIGLLDAAEVCCRDLVNVGLFDNDKYICNRASLYTRGGDINAAYNYLTEKIEEANFFSSQVVMGELARIAKIAGKEDEVLEFFRRAVQESKYAKWISRPYIKGCLAKGLEEEALQELERLKGIIVYTYSDGVVNRMNQGLIRYYASVRKLLNLPCTVAEVAMELGYVLDLDPHNSTSVLYQNDNANNTKPKQVAQVSNSPWENDFNKLGNKALIRRVNKMNKPFRTYFKLFAGGEKELIYAKCIFGNFMSIIAHRFSKLFGAPDFQVTDYDLFYEKFPFYGLNGFTEDEVDEISVLLKRIADISVQLNPFVTSRSFPASQMLEEILSVNTTLDTGTKKTHYTVSEKGQLTVFGVILLMCTFLNNSEKEALAYELTASDTKRMIALLKQIFKTIPAADDHTQVSDAFTEAGREKGVFSLFLRKELFRFLLEIECSIIKDKQLISSEMPNTNCKYFADLIDLRYPKHSGIHTNLMKLHKVAVSGILLGETVWDTPFTIANIVQLLASCRAEDPSSTLFQAGIESLFIISTNRKYYNQLKWNQGRSGGTFLQNTDNYCKKLLYRNNDLMTLQDETILFNEARERLFTHTDDAQSREFYALFGNKGFEWTKTTITMHQIDLSKCQYKINGEEFSGEFCMIYEDDTLEITGIDGYKFDGWDTAVVFDSPMAQHIIKKARFMGGR